MENRDSKRKVPGFTFDKVEMPYSTENGLRKGAGKTRALCYTYDGDLFDGLPEGDGCCRRY